MQYSTISIIVPIYNVQEYLARCLDSIINQTYEKLEILLINDGSTDKSLEIAQLYAEKDARIKIFSQKNSGLSMARNAGIEQATGEYILFVDSDDYIELDSCEKLVAVAQYFDCDVVCADGIWVTQNKKEELAYPRPGLQFPCVGTEFLVYSLKHNIMTMCSVYALYKRQFINDSDQRFKPGVYHEDELWTPQVYLKAQRVYHLDYCFYYHWYREGSITSNQTTKKIRAMDGLRICDELFSLTNTTDFQGKEYLYDRICKLNLSFSYLGKVTEKCYRVLPLKTAYSVRNKIKARLYYYLPHVYFTINSTQKKLLYLNKKRKKNTQ